KTWPKEVLADIYSDPVWQANVVRAFEIASMLLKIKQMPGSHATGRRALEDPSDALEVYYNLTNVVKHVLAKHNIDKHGRRLPPRR
ncbi:hypothetical protein, partial [Salmonella sp. s60093]|uniref:hypothetical protein n=1 Tax=Salmonella sp. s60093 TaxID=3159721 RepID=UPI0039807431